MPVVKVTAEEFKKICGKSTTGLSRLSCRQFKQDAQAFWYQQKRLAALSFHGPDRA